MSPEARRRHHSPPAGFFVSTVAGAALAPRFRGETGAIGAAVGLGNYEGAVTISAFTFLTLKLLPLMKEKSETDVPKPARGTARKKARPRSARA